jgi:signal transduction histidine kinase
MNLIRYTISRISLLLIPFILFGGIFTYQVFKFIAYSEIDEFLQYEKNRILAWHELNHDVPDVNTIVRVYPVEAPFMPFFSDTLLLETADMEMAPHRELHFSLTHEDRHLGVVIRHLLLGSEDILKGAALLMGGITLLIVLLILGGVTVVARSVWQPFFDTINRIQSYRPDQLPDVLPAQRVFEFDLLNTSVNQMSRKIWMDYNRTKSFNENAAHELQTQLALIKSAAEQLPDRLEEDEEGMKVVQAVHEATTRLSIMLRALLLLSKIGNREFPDKKPVELQPVTENVLDFFSETMQMRNIRLSVNLQNTSQVMDPGLATILITNLIKNAVLHNVQDGHITITLDKDRFETVNTGPELDGPASDYLSRFRKGKTGNMGLGLAIVNEICRLYGFDLDYQAEDGLHHVTVRFSEEST